MLNPNNIKGKTFDTEKNGYSKEDVKEFLGQVAEDYAEVVKANQDTEAKIIKLVEKINEYREDEEAIQQALVVAQKESNKILTEAKTQAHDMIESAKTEQVRLAEQSASECERIVKEHKEKCAELIRTNTEITEKKINEVRAAYDEELAKFENLKAEVTQFKADLTQLYNKQIRLIMEIPASEPAEDSAEEYEEEIGEKVSKVVRCKVKVRSDDMADTVEVWCVKIKGKWYCVSAMMTVANLIY